MRLKLDSQEFAICAYTKGSGPFIANNSAFDESKKVFFTPESFKRRGYWLKEEKPRYVLVHYLDEAEKYQRKEEDSYAKKDQQMYNERRTMIGCGSSTTFS